MANPITGPFASVRYGGKPPSASFYDNVAKYHQVKPYDLPAPYKREYRYYGHLSTGGTNPEVWSDFEASVVSSLGDVFPMRMVDSRITTELDFLTNKARAKMVDQLGASAAIGETIGEYKQLQGMLGTKFGAIAGSLKQLSRGNLAGAILALGQPVSTGLGSRLLKKYKGNPIAARRTRRRVKARVYTPTVTSFAPFSAASKVWLELHFGWAPLVQDIYAIIDLLTSPTLKGVATGKASKTVPWSHNQTSYPGGARYSYQGVHTTRYRVLCQTDWEVHNPNLFLANRLGLVNAASIAWNLVPLSFLIDWFASVNQVLDEWSDFLGVTTSNSFYTVTCRDAVDSSVVVNYPGETLYMFQRAQTKSIYTERKLGIPGVRLGIKPLARLSMSRSVTASALLCSIGLKKL
jgi:hypothetical protein